MPAYTLQSGFKVCAPRQCVICHTTLVRRPGQRANNFLRQQLCSQHSCRSAMGAKSREKRGK